VTSVRNFASNRGDFLNLAASIIQVSESERVFANITIQLSKP
jgi:hypothetical protein